MQRLCFTNAYSCRFVSLGDFIVEEDAIVVKTKDMFIQRVDFGHQGIIVAIIFSCIY
jgi:hypothetical protein